MTRPLTAADRTPEVGDVLLSLGGHTYEVVRLCELGTAEVYTKGRYRGRVPKPTWVYQVRADGGPITTEG